MVFLCRLTNMSSILMSKHTKYRFIKHKLIKPPNVLIFNLVNRLCNLRKRLAPDRTMYAKNCPLKRSQIHNFINRQKNCPGFLYAPGKRKKKARHFLLTLERIVVAFRASYLNSALTKYIYLSWWRSHKSRVKINSRNENKKRCEKGKKELFDASLKLI